MIILLLDDAGSEIRTPNDEVLKFRSLTKKEEKDVSAQIITSCVYDRSCDY